MTATLFRDRRACAPDGAAGGAPLPARLLRGHRVGAGLSVEAADWIAASLAGIEAAPPDPALLSQCRANGFEIEIAVRTLDHVVRCCTLVGPLLGLSPQSVMGVQELLLNGVEHGNLGISFEHKSALLASRRWQEEIARRLEMPGYRDRYAWLTARVGDGNLEIRIRDEGPGFDWRRYLDAPVLPPGSGRHGRGIVLARVAGFSRLTYIGCGNEVVVHARPESMPENLRRRESA